jgi:hypothetical protein
MSIFFRRIVRLGPSLGNLVVSAAGGLIFMGGNRLIALAQEEPDAGSATRAADRSPKRSMGIDAAVFLLAFVASEALAMICALRH